MRGKIAGFMALCLTLAILSNSSQAGQYVLSGEGSPSAGGDPTASLSAIPTLQLDLAAASTAELSLWFKPRGNLGAANAERISGLGLDIWSNVTSGTNPAVATSFSLYDGDAIQPGSFPLPDTNHGPRWNNFGLGAVGAVGDEMFLSGVNAVAFDSRGVSESVPNFFDGERYADPGNPTTDGGTFYLGALDVSGLSVGTVELYLQVGAATITVAGEGGADIQFGTGPLTADAGADIGYRNALGSPDAIIEVIDSNGGGGDAVSLSIETNPSGATFDFDDSASAGNLKSTIDFGSPTGAGTAIFRSLNDAHDENLMVFFDLDLGGSTIGDVIGLFDSVAGVTAEDATGVWSFNGFDYDLKLTFDGAGNAGRDAVLGFDFSSLGVTANAAAVPEPTSLALAALACVGLVGFGRHRRR